MPTSTQNVSVNDNMIVYIAAAMFLGFLATALVSYARSERMGEGGASPIPRAWALCAKRLCLAAIFAALVIMISMASSLVVMLGMPTSFQPGAFFDPAPWVAFAKLTFAVEAIALAIAMVIGLRGVLSLFPQFGLSAAWNAGRVEPARDSLKN